MFHCMFSTTFKLVQPQFVPIYTVGLFQLRAMASSSPTTSIPIQEPVFLQFLHDVHHAYLLLHRAMALLPHSFPTLNRHLYPAQTYGTNLKASDRSILTRPMPLLMLYTFLRLTTLMKKLLWMICWNLIFLNHINMLLLHRLMPFNHGIDTSKTQTEGQSNSQSTCETPSTSRTVEIPFPEPFDQLDCR